jgi:dTDP-4-amino-4,6-dideoxygalactose transaminase
MTPSPQLGDLAIFGKPPAFAERLHVGRPNRINRARFLEAVGRILDRNILTNGGPEVCALEESFSRMTGTAHAVAVANATLGLQLVARALGLRGRVVMPAFTFIATAHALKWIGLDPVFCDIDPATHNLDPRQVAADLASGASAVVGVHVWGRLCAPLELEKICSDHRVPLLFDAAHAVGCRGYGRSAGAFGTAEVFSLHATKICSSFEGGIVTTADAALAAEIRQMRNFGFAGYDQVNRLGINAKLPEVSAAMGRVSLESLGEYCEANRANAAWYREGLKATRGLRLLDLPSEQVSNHQYVVAEIDPEWPDQARDLLYAALHAEGVLVRRYFYPGCHRLEPYISERACAASALPHTDSLCRRVLCFPNGTAIGKAEIDRICALTQLILGHLPEVKMQLSSAKPYPDG